MHRRSLLLAGGSALVAGLVSSAGGVSAHNDLAGARTIFDRISAERLLSKRSALTAHPALMAMTRAQVLHIYDLGEATHLDAQDGNPAQRALSFRYDGQIRGEALADTYEAPEAVAQLWLSNSATRSVVLNPRAREVGITGMRDSSGRSWWSIVLGMQSKTPLPKLGEQVAQPATRQSRHFNV